MNLKFMIFLSIGFFLGACETTKTQNNAPLKNEVSNFSSSIAKTNKANVTFVRIRAMPLALSAKLKIDGAELARLKNKQYAKAYIEPGQHLLKVSFPGWSLQPGTTKEILIEAEKEYFFELTSNLSSGIINGQGYANVGVFIKEIDLENISNYKVVLKDCCKDVSTNR